MSLNYMVEVKKNQIADFHMVAIVNKHVRKKQYPAFHMVALWSLNNRGGDCRSGQGEEI